MGTSFPGMNPDRIEDESANFLPLAVQHERDLWR